MYENEQNYFIIIIINKILDTNDMGVKTKHKKTKKNNLCLSFKIQFIKKTRKEYLCCYRLKQTDELVIYTGTYILPLELISLLHS